MLLIFQKQIMADISEVRDMISCLSQILQYEKRNFNEEFWNYTVMQFQKIKKLLQETILN